MPREHNNSWGMVLSPEHGMNRNACKISTLGKIWEEKYFCLCYAGYKSRTGREYDAEIPHRPQLLIRPGDLPDTPSADCVRATASGKRIGKGCSATASGMISRTECMGTAHWKNFERRSRRSRCRSFHNYPLDNMCYTVYYGSAKEEER